MLTNTETNRKKWYHISREMNKLHEYLANEGSSDSQIHLAKKLLSEAQIDNNYGKREVAIDWILKAAKYGDEEAVHLLKVCFAKNIGINDRNKSLIIKCLSRNEMDIKSEIIANHIITSLTCDSESQLSDKQFIERLQKFVYLKSDIKVNNSYNKTFPINESILALNVKQVLQYENPSIEITMDSSDGYLFGKLGLFLRNGIALMDSTLVLVLFIVIYLNLILNLIFFKPNVKLMYKNLLSPKMLFLSLHAIQAISFAKVIQIVDGFNNFKLWSHLISLCDSQNSLNLSNYFRKSFVWFSIFFITYVIESNIKLIISDCIDCDTYAYFYHLKQVMIIISFLTFIKYNPNSLSILFTIIEISSLVYLRFRSYSLLIHTIVCISATILSFKQIFNWISFNLIIISNIFSHLLVYKLNFNEMDFYIIIVFFSIVILLKRIEKCYLITIIWMITIFSADFFFYLYNEYSVSLKFFANITLLTIVFHFFRNLDMKQKLKLFLITSVLFFLFFQIQIYRERHLYIKSEKTLSWDKYFDNCQDLNNITKQMECFDLTLTHKIEAISLIKSVRIKRITNNFKLMFHFLDYTLSNSYFTNRSSIQKYINEWRVFDYEIAFIVKFSNTELLVDLHHNSIDFISKLRVGDIYKIDIIYDNINNKAFLLEAKCTTCWDLIEWHYS